MARKTRKSKNDVATKKVISTKIKKSEKKAKSAKTRKAKVTPAARKPAAGAKPTKKPSRTGTPRSKTIGPIPSETDFKRMLIKMSSFGLVASGKNDKVLDGILGGHFPNDTKLDPPYDGAARSGLADRLQAAGIPVSDAKVIACTTVGCVRDAMKSANPGGV